MDRLRDGGLGTGGLLHGADWFPEQWQDSPGVIQEDIRLMKEAGCNVVSIGMFAWSALEPAEGKLCFGWLDRVFEGLAENRIRALLATPSGARPAWMSARYPEVLRVEADRRRNLHGQRHNHCYTSPVYREKTRAINAALAERYGQHPALLAWHVSNEYGGECHCSLCQEAFRAWLRQRYRDDIGTLNRAWWASFWGHTFSAWEQVESPSPHGEPLLQGLTLDWKRFVTHQTASFLEAEIAPLKAACPQVPVTTNLMGTYPGLDSWRIAPLLDLVSWNSYPAWHGRGPVFDGGFPWDPEGRDWVTAAATGFTHDLMRTLKDGHPFLLMESAPTFSSWHKVWKVKKPGMHALSSLLAVAHGADSVQYFQWRRSRGGAEKFHGAVVETEGPERSRAFREIADTGEVLGALAPVAGTRVRAEAAILFDWENRWALEGAAVAPASGEGTYSGLCARHHRPLWSLGIATDVPDSERDLSAYRLVVAPLLSMVKPGVAERLESFVRNGGTLVTTYCSGLVDHHDLRFAEAAPGPLRRLLGIRVEESDSLYPVEHNALVMERGNPLGIRGTFTVRRRCDLVEPETASVLGRYAQDFYRGKPALTVNAEGDGKAYYIAADVEDRFLAAFYGALARPLGLRRATASTLPEGVSAHLREGESGRFLFLLNFTQAQAAVRLGEGTWLDAVTGAARSGRVVLPPLGYIVLRQDGERDGGAGREDSRT